MMLPLDAIDPNPTQPRVVFDPQALNELADSIRANGLVQPIVVRRKAERFEIVAGERRWRACRLAEMDEVPVVVQDVADEKILELALIENIQRQDLNPIETATAFARLVRDLEISHEEIGRRTGKDRTTITNFIRLLKLPTDLQQLTAENRLSMGHARAILGLPTEELQRQVAEKTVTNGLSVRAVERMIQGLLEKREPEGEEKAEPPIDPNIKAAIENLEMRLGTRVRIVARDEKRGQIEIDYYSQDELHRIYQQIVGD
jgi:ParB family chromosome partitioning protein